ncbi:rab11 family-interacting protein 3 isoform X4 [Pseudonaja textilis]|uniref:rab11 family-interacting protein 3 isoform X4 n=1 Tax=Pseudonaja textilis TaxID=8673 RepID=UPI000EAA28A0|nr:rab11 family-interacting protein 3 isoform X4 [Pseudonaja textilis]
MELRSLADPGASTAREARLSLEPLEAEGLPRRPPSPPPLPGPELPRFRLAGSPVGGSSSASTAAAAAGMLPDATPPPSLEQVLRGMAERGPRRASSSSPSSPSSSSVGGCLPGPGARGPDGPIRCEESDSGAGDRLQDAAGPIQEPEEREPWSCLAEPPLAPDLRLEAATTPGELDQAEEPFCPISGIPPGSFLDLAAPPEKESYSPELLLDCSWTEEMEDCTDSHPGRGPPLLRPLMGTPPSTLLPPLRSSNDLAPHLPLGQQAQHLEEELPGCLEDAPQLQTVFRALDQDDDGFVRIEEFVQFATVYGAEQVKDLIKFLDPIGLGVISFEDFCRGISAIRNGDPDSQLCPLGYTPDETPPACADEFDDFVAYEANEVTDSAYMGSESTYSECETFTDEDTSTLVHHEMHDEVETDSAVDSTVHSEIMEPEETENRSHPHDLSLTTDVNSHSIVTVISGEEHFEDYGEGNEGDVFSDSLCNGESGFSSSSFLSPSPNKRLSSKKVARHLHQTGSFSMDNIEQPFQKSSECLEEDITDKVIFLEKRVTELEKDTAANGEQQSRLKQENLQLVHRANALEEQLKEQEMKSDEILIDEIRKQRDLLSRMEREKSMEIENLQARLHQLDNENGELRSCVPCLKANIERLEEEKQKLLDEIEDLAVQLTEERENKRKLGEKLNHERHQFQKDKESRQELIEDLRKQLEHLQVFKLEAEQRRGRSSSIGLQEYNSRTRENELEQEIRRLKQDNRNLKEQNDELNGQIINLSIQGAKNLFSASFSESLAAEISLVSRDELMEAIQKQEEINFRLQDYIDRIIVAIMETNPSILEVKNGAESGWPLEIAFLETTLVHKQQKQACAAREGAGSLGTWKL